MKIQDGPADGESIIQRLADGLILTDRSVLGKRVDRKITLSWGDLLLGRYILERNRWRFTTAKGRVRTRRPTSTVPSLANPLEMWIDTTRCSQSVTVRTFAGEMLRYITALPST